MKRLLPVLALVCLSWAPAAAAGHGGDAKLEPFLQTRAHDPRGFSRVIVETSSAEAAETLIRSLGGTPGRRLPILGALVAEIPDGALHEVAEGEGIRSVRLDRRVTGAMERTAATIGATWVREQLGFDGAGVGIAMLDSGVTGWHDDLTYDGPATPLTRNRPPVLGSQRVVHFVDFVSHWPQPYDDYGHGTHVAGILAGNGYDSGGARAGVAPRASLVALKVLDSTGNGFISNVIAAIDYAVARRRDFNIRILNISVTAAVTESYETDPLTVAARRAVEAGLIVVTAAGNRGRAANGDPAAGGIGAPGNAPWVITVGASSHMGTTDRADDTVAAFSSRGPALVDFAAKPDLVAPGVGIESLSEQNSYLYRARPQFLLPGTISTPYLPYLSLTGTSMAAPVVAGTVALMLQANPGLTPNAVKAILEFTAETRAGADYLTQGSGFLDARGAVELAAQFAAGTAGAQIDRSWSRHIIWGNQRIGGGMIQPSASAWAPDIMWGAAFDGRGEHIVWGTTCAAGAADCAEGERIVWGTACDPADPGCEQIVWGTSESENVVWGTECAGADCENIVWGTACGPDDPACEHLVRGASGDDGGILWGTAVPDVVWPQRTPRSSRPGNRGRRGVR
jgi:subtilisin family serine protease